MSLLSLAALAIVAAQRGSALGQLACSGSCGGDGLVGTNDLLLTVDVLLGSEPPSACFAFASVQSGGDITRIVQSVGEALSSCPPRCALCGDADGSGRVDAKDALLVAQVSADPSTPVQCLNQADVNDDRSVTLEDARVIEQFVLGLRPALLCGPAPTPSASPAASATPTESVTPSATTTPTATHTPSATPTAIATPTATPLPPSPTASPSGTPSAKPTPTVTSTLVPTVTPTATATSTPTATTTPGSGVILLFGQCVVPDIAGAAGGGLLCTGCIPCPPRTLVKAFRCKNSQCVHSDSAREHLKDGRDPSMDAIGRTDADGRFAIAVRTTDIANRRLLFIADVGVAEEESSIVDFPSLAAPGAVNLRSSASTPALDIVISPDSSGVVSAVDSDGLENFGGNNLARILDGTQAAGLNYRRDSIVSATLKAQGAAQRQIEPQLRIETSVDGRIAYYFILNGSIFDYAITTVAVDGGSGDGGVNSCEVRGFSPGGAAVGDDVPDPADVLTTPLLRLGISDVGKVGFDPLAKGRVFTTCQAGACNPSYAIDDGMQPIAARSSATPTPTPAAAGIRPATKLTAPPVPLNFETCTLTGDTYAFGVGPGVQLSTRRALHDPAPADGFRLAAGGDAVVFASVTTINPIGFGIGGFRLDEHKSVIKGLGMDKDIPSGRTQLALGAPASVTIGGFAKALAVRKRDVNGKQLSDLLVADDANDVVNVRSQQSDGSYTAPTPYSVGSSPVGLAVADLDIVTANNGSGDISVRRGYVDGTFADETRIAVAPFPVAVAVGDLDNMNGLDVVTAHEPSGLSVLLRDGSGGFDAAKEVPGPDGSYPSALAIADLDGDGRDDVVTADEGTGTVSVWQSGPGGLLTLLKSYPAVDFPGAIVLANLNDDNLPDIAVASQTDGIVAVLLNQGNAAFALAVTYRVDPKRQCVGLQPCPSGLFPIALAAGDLDGVDGLDLIVANAGSGDVSVLLNKGDGSFDPPRPFAAVQFPIAVGVVDVNGNGAEDIVVVSETAATAVLLPQ